MTFKAVIFDVDGVLVDSEYVFLTSIRHFLHRHQLDADFDELSYFLGKPEAEITEIVREKYGFRDSCSFDEIRHGIYDEYAEVMESGKVDPMPQVSAFLSFLKENGILTAVATSGTVHHYEQIRRGIRLDHTFDVIVTFEDVTKGKPDPEIFLEAAKRLEKFGIQPEEIAVIEDSPNGIQAAKDAGLYVFGYKGSHIRQDTSKADMEIYSFDEIRKYFTGGEKKMKLAIGNDHVAVDMKNQIKAYLEEKGYEVINVGTDTTDSFNYPVSGYKVARLVADGEVDGGILICGTGVGISLAANKVHGIRACVCSEPYTAKLSKQHNNTNIIAFGARVIGIETAKMIVDEWLNAEYEGGRHAVRVGEIMEIEETQHLKEAEEQ